MADNLPDEIISEILSPALRVSDAVFSTPTDFGGSPFMTFCEPSSAYLVVCKAWLRVATPLLYNVVVLRSKAQAQALAGVLKENPALGRFIKKIRVEGGYAISMYKILKASPNITDLFFTLEIASSDNACGLCRGLPLVDPSRVILDVGRYYYSLSKHALPLLEVLEKCILNWTKLTHFELPNQVAVRHTAISDALGQAPTLHTISIWDYSDTLRDIPEYMRTVAANPSLKRIRIEPLSARRFVRQVFYQRAKKDDKLKRLVVLPPDPVDKAEAPPSSLPMVLARLAADPEQEDAIWSRVLYFALTFRLYRRLTPLLVCKKFARLGAPYLYTSPTLNYKQLASFAARLAEQPALGSRVRFLTIQSSVDPSTFLNIVAHTPALEELGSDRGFKAITWKVFSDLAKSTGASLQVFHGMPMTKATSPVSPAVFALFVKVYQFEWDSRTTFKSDRKLIPAGTFSQLVHLLVNRFDESFLNTLAHMELPCLRTVAFPADACGGVKFLESHGAKLQQLTASVSQLENSKLAIWRNCPNLTVLTVSCDDKFPASASCLVTSETHAQLERIAFKVGFYRLKKPHAVELGKLITALRSSTSFPALHEVLHPCCRWPTTEAEILKSNWVRWAESLLERGVHLVGPQHVHWRPRLKFVSKGKQ
ncbi:hypothetical protein DFH06DRAFT_1488667 [Mycena polygramma]|nr:hypothetical protein DFH06DRAFT_1488667 [Mycena polygramma]